MESKSLIVEPRKWQHANPNHNPNPQCPVFFCASEQSKVLKSALPQRRDIEDARAKLGKRSIPMKRTSFQSQKRTQNVCKNNK